MKLLLASIGLLMILEGTPYLAAPKTVKTVLAHLSEQREDVLRWIGFGLVGTGAIVMVLTRAFFSAAP